MRRKTILITAFFFGLLVVAVAPITASARERHRFHVSFSYGSPGYYGYYYQPAPQYYYQPEPEYYYYQPQPSYYYYRVPRYRYYQVYGGGYSGRYGHMDNGRHRGWYKHND
jgi:hypothetical protein